MNDDLAAGCCGAPRWSSSMARSGRTTKWSVPDLVRRPANAWVTCRCRGPDGSIAAFVGIGYWPQDIRSYEQHQPGAAPGFRPKRPKPKPPDGSSDRTGWRSHHDPEPRRLSRPACARSARSVTTTCTPSITRLHGGDCTPDQVRAWVINRYYYQHSIPMKDAAFMSPRRGP